MRESHAAEWILTLVMSPDRASSTVGDLLEAAASRGRLWFWTQIAGTMAALLWRDLKADPARMAWLALHGLFLEAAFFGLFIIAIGFLFALVGMFFAAVGLSDFLKQAPDWLPAALAVIIGWIAFRFQIGRVLARRSPGRELAPCVAFAILTQIIDVTIGLAWLGAAFVGNATTLALSRVVGFAVSLVLWAPMLAGAISVRRKAMSRPSIQI